MPVFCVSVWNGKSVELVTVSAPNAQQAIHAVDGDPTDVVRVGE